MRVALLGRTRWLIDAGRRLLAGGHEIGLVATAKAADYDSTGPDDYARFGEEIGAAFLRTAGLDAALATTGHDCSLAISVNWPTILGEGAIKAFGHGILNVHAGDLPRYRGNAVVNWAILNGESRIGLCVHRMVPGEVDSGEVLGRMHLAIGDETYVGDVYGWLDQAIPDLVATVVDDLSRGIVRPDLQRPAGPPLRCYPRRPEDGRIDWTRHVEQVHRLVRASSRPFAGAFTTFEGQDTVRIWAASVVPASGDVLAIPGQVMERLEGDPVIACGDGALRLTDMTIDGLDDPMLAKATVARSLRNRLW
jgi:methionyl-tRNA formyltransferase